MIAVFRWGYAWSVVALVSAIPYFFSCAFTMWLLSTFNGMIPWVYLAALIGLIKSIIDFKNTELSVYMRQDAKKGIFIALYALGFITYAFARYHFVF